MASVSFLVLQYEGQSGFGVAYDHNLRVLRFGEPLRGLDAFPLQKLFADALRRRSCMSARGSKSAIAQTAFAGCI